MNKFSHDSAFEEDKKITAGILLYNNFQFENIQHFLYDKCTEYHEPYYDKIPDEPQGIGLDIFWCNKLHDNKETDERKTKEHPGVDTLCKGHNDRDYCEPYSKGNNGDLLFSHHQDSCL